MKYFTLVFLFFAFLLPQSVFAHGAGLPPFFKVNGQIAAANPLQTGGVIGTAFPIAQDLVPEKFVQNQSINFEIDTSILGTFYPPELLSKSNYDWDFGDGAKAQGLKNTHTYTKTGSYILQIIQSYNQDQSTSQLIESVQINVVPSNDYQLPKAVIRVNGKRIEEKNNSLQIDLNKKLQFDGSLSTASSKNVQYIWDFGDSQTSSKDKVSHKYKLPQYYVSPILRVTDANGIFSDTYVDITNSGKNEPTPEGLNDNQKNLIIGSIILLPLLLLAGLFGIKKFKKRNRNISAQ